MNSAQRQLVERAIGSLKLRDVFLHECHFRRPAPAPDAEVDALKQTKRAVRYKLGDAPSESADGVEKLLQVQVELGVRIVESDVQNSPIYVEIEATFTVEYEVVSVVDDDAIRAFSDFNSVHNVWPFWRQHVYDIVARARLPHIDVPLFGGLKTPTTDLTNNAEAN